MSNAVKHFVAEVAKTLDHQRGMVQILGDFGYGRPCNPREKNA